MGLLKLLTNKQENPKMDESVVYEHMYRHGEPFAIWRSIKGLYPEQLMRRNAGRFKWLSDYGFGDYESDRRSSSEIKTYSFSSLPERLKEMVLNAEGR